MIKIYIFSLVVCTSPFLIAMQNLKRLSISRQTVYEHNGVRYKKNNFGDILPLWQEIKPDQLSIQLPAFVHSLKDSIKGNAFIVEVPHQHSSIIETLKNAHFTFHYANNDKTEWIFKNESSIPHPYTTSMGSQIIIKKADTILVVEEKTRKGDLGFPGGTTDFNELPHNAATRELYEEVNLHTNTHDLELISIFSRRNINRYGANGLDFSFLVTHDKISGELIPDSQEILQAFYAPLIEIAHQEYVQNLKVSPAIAAVAQFILNGRTHSYAKTCLDFRQVNKSPSEQDQNDTMTLEFFAK